MVFSPALSYPDSLLHRIRILMFLAARMDRRELVLKDLAWDFTCSTPSSRKADLLTVVVYSIADSQSPLISSGPLNNSYIVRH